MVRTLVDILPLWGVFLATLGLAAAATELGFRAGGLRNRAAEPDDESHVSATTGALLALLGFLLAFTFSLAADHHTTRKQLILEEIIAVDAAYMRTGLIDEQVGENIRKGLREYVELTANFKPGDDVDAMLKRADELRVEIWSHVESLAGGDVGEFEALLVDSVNRVFEVHEQRVAAGKRVRIPGSIWRMLYVVLLTAAFGMGYFSGMKGKRSSITATAMTISLAMIMWLISDLDRPQAGFVKSDLSSLKEFSERLR